MRVSEPAADLAVCSAIHVGAARQAAAARLRSPSARSASTGELRPAPRGQERAAEARKLGFTRVVLPKSSAEQLTAAERKGTTLLPAERLDDALAQLF